MLKIAISHVEIVTAFGRITMSSAVAVDSFTIVILSAICA
jgi:hypothetical protein